MPYLVLTVLPSTSGSRSRCTPSRETSAPAVSCRRAILSISSRNTMPFCSALRSAWTLSSSSLTSFAASSSVSSLNASRTLSRRERVRLPPRFENMPCSCWDSSSMPGGAMISTPDRHRAHLDLDLALVELALAQHLAKALTRVALRGVAVGSARRSRPSRGRGRQQSSSTRSSAASIARCRTLSISCSRVILTAMSTRSLMIESTSRPT